MLEKGKQKIKNAFNNFVSIVSVMLLNIACLKIGTAPLGIDYADYYATGKMVISGDIFNIYNMAAHHKALESYFGKIPYLLEWIYPPTFLLPIVPLSYLPFQISYPIWMIITFIPAALSVYYLTNNNKQAPLIFFLFPGTFLNIRWGQNGFLTAALFGFGVYFAETNPLLSGLMFGLLTFKPQMAIIPFIVLLLLKKWKVLGWSCVFATALATLSGLVFGFDTWINFFSTAQYNASRLGASWEKTNWGIPTLSTSLRCMGVTGWVLTAILLLVAALSFYSCVRVWKQTSKFSLRAMSLVLCLFLSFPYISLYDYAIFGVPFTLLFFERIEKKVQTFHPLSLVLLWVLPMVCLFLFVKTNIQIFPFLLMGYMAAVVNMSGKSSPEQSLQEAK